MKKTLIITLILFASLFISSFSSKPPNMSTPVSLEHTTYLISPYIDLEKLPEDYPPKTAMENGDIIDIHGFGYNVEILNNFLLDFKNNNLKVGDMIRIIRYSVEGYPTIEDLTFTKDGTMLTVDNSRKMYPSQEIKDFKKYLITDIYVEKNNDLITYIAKTYIDEKIPLASFNL